jgi:hypothetical protein
MTQLLIQQWVMRIPKTQNHSLDTWVARSCRLAFARRENAVSEISRPSFTLTFCRSGEQSKGTVQIDQSRPPADLLARGTLWASLGQFVVEGGSLRVVLSNVGSKENVMADAWRCYRADARPASSWTTPIRASSPRST